MSTFFTVQDTNGQWWQVTVTTGGLLQTTAVASGAGTPANLGLTPNSLVTCQNILDYARAHTLLKPILGIGGVSNEPGLSICNDVLQYLLSRPFAWKFNKVVGNFFVTQAFIQDYYFAGACAFTLNPVVASGGAATFGGGGVGIDLAINNAITESGFTVTVNCLQPHNLTVGQTVYLNGVTDASGNPISAYNSVFTMNTNAMTSVWSGGWTITATPTLTSFQFVHSQSGLGTGGAPGITNLGWLQGGVQTDINNNGVPQPTGTIEALDNITPTGNAGPPEQLAVIKDFGQGGTPPGLSGSVSYPGVIQFRINPTAGPYAMSVTPIYQAKAPILTSTRSNFSPWPDSLAYVLRQGVLAMAYRLTDKDAKTEAEFARFGNAIQSALSYMDTEASNESFAPRVPIMR